MFTWNPNYKGFSLLFEFIWVTKQNFKIKFLTRLCDCTLFYSVLSWFLPSSNFNGGLNLKICQNFVGQKLFLNLWEDKPLWGELKLYEGGVIFITTLSLFHFFRNSQHSEKWNRSFKNFFRKCECIRTCYLPISSNLLRKSFRKTSLFVFTVIGTMEKVFC